MVSRNIQRVSCWYMQFQYLKYDGSKHLDYYQPAVEQLYEIMTPIIDTTGKMNKFIEVFGVSEEIISPFGKKNA